MYSSNPLFSKKCPDISIVRSLLVGTSELKKMAGNILLLSGGNRSLKIPNSKSWNVLK
jgi:hypothetical protein